MISKRVKRVLLLRVLKMAKEDYLQAKEDYLRSSRTLEKAEKQYAVTQQGGRILSDFLCTGDLCK